MRLGTRWSVGDEPPRGLPDALVAAIRAVEARLDSGDAARVRWTLSWLENRPSVELDDGTLLELGPDGSVVESH